MSSSANDIFEDKHQQEQLQALIDSSPLALVEFGLDTRIRLWNPAAERIFGWSREEMLGRGDLPMAPPSKRAESEELFARVSAGESLNDYETVRQRRMERSSTSRSRPPRSETHPAGWSATWSPTPTSPSARRRRRRSIV
jgi:PAS domain S-box-containing protein